MLLAEQNTGEGFSMMLAGENYTRRRDAGERLIELLAEHAFIREEKRIGTYRGSNSFLRTIFRGQGESSCSRAVGHIVPI